MGTSTSSGVSMTRPKFLVRPKKGPTMLKIGNSWNLVPLLASSTKGGERGMLKAPGLDYKEGQAI
jgi:hypothetical protein